MNNEQAQQADDPSGPGWRDVSSGEILHVDDMVKRDNGWGRTRAAGTPAGYQRYRRRIEQQAEPEPQPEPQPDPQPEPQLTPDDPSGPGWRDVEPDELLLDGDMLKNNTGLWLRTRMPGRLAREGFGGTYRRRIEPPQVSDSEPETMEDLRRRLAECEVLLAEADRGGQQVNAELQQLREQVLALTLERDRLQSWLQQHHTTGQQSAIKKLERWLKPVVKVVADHPDHSSILAVSVLEFLPQIASRLIEE